MGKNLKLLAFALWSLSTIAVAQTAKEDYDVIKIDSTSHRAYRPGQVLVKFKDTSTLKVRGRASGKVSANQQKVQSLMDKFGVNEVEQLMPKSGAVKMGASARLRSVTGKVLEDRDLTKLYLLKLDKKQPVQEVVEAFTELDEVEFAEPNYMVYALGTPAPLPQPSPPGPGPLPSPPQPLDQALLCPSQGGAQRTGRDFPGARGQARAEPRLAPGIGWGCCPQDGAATPPDAHT